jgi:DnaJ domain
VFDRPESLLDDVDQVTETQTFPLAGSTLSSSELGQGIIMLSLGRMPTACLGLVADDRVTEAQQQTARQLVARWFLAGDSNLYTVLGVTCDCTHEMLRENYRRLMGLVHPDTRPVGFPDDSASRVNMAYSVLADAERRASYDSSIVLLSQQNPVPSPPTAANLNVRGQARQQDGIFDRFRTAVPQVRFGNGLLGIAAIMLLPIGYAVFLLAGRDTQPQIVEARPKLSMSPEFASRGETVSSSEMAANTSAAATAPIASSTASGGGRVSAATTENQPPTTAELQPTLTFSNRLQRLISGNTQAVAAPRESQPRGQSNVVSLAPSRSASDSGTLVQQETLDTGRPSSANAAAAAPISNSAEKAVAKLANAAGEGASQMATNDATARVATTQPQSAVPQSKTLPPPAPDTRVNAADADDILGKLSGAYESGSIAAFSKVFATSMAGRRQLLSDYERVFQQTRQRTIRFTQFKHKVSGEKLLTSGFAVVSTIDNDNRASSQRIFLEIDIGREAEGLRIERMHNYPLN